MKYVVTIKERFDNDKTMVEDILKCDVVGRYNSYKTFEMFKGFVQSNLMKEGSTFYIYLHRIGDHGQRALLDSVVCKGGLTADRYRNQVNNFISREVLDERGIYHGKDTD